MQKIKHSEKYIFPRKVRFQYFFFVNSYDLVLNKVLRLYNLVNNSTINATEFRNVLARPSKPLSSAR